MIICDKNEKQIDTTQTLSTQKNVISFSQTNNKSNTHVNLTC